MSAYLVVLVSIFGYIFIDLKPVSCPGLHTAFLRNDHTNYYVSIFQAVSREGEQ